MAHISAKKHLIGFLDSGVGGISVLACAKRFIKNADYIYYADTDNVPYGTKAPSEIIEYVDKAIACLVERGVEAIVVACNTATSIAIEAMREKYPLPLIGMEPAIKPAVKRHPDGRVLVCATAATVAGARLHSLIGTVGAHPDLYALSDLVSFAEAGVFDKATVCEYLNSAIPDRDSYDAVVLGCTHFTYFRDAFAESFRNAELIDGNMGAVKRLASLLELEINTDAPDENTATTFLRSGREVTDESEIASFRAYENRMAEYYKNVK